MNDETIPSTPEQAVTTPEAITQATPPAAKKLRKPNSELLQVVVLTEAAAAAKEQLPSDAKIMLGVIEAAGQITVAALEAELEKKKVEGQLKSSQSPKRLVYFWKNTLVRSGLISSSKKIKDKTVAAEAAPGEPPAEAPAQPLAEAAT